MEANSKSYILNSLFGHGRRLGADSDGVNEAAKITFTIIFYSLFALMLVAFWIVFKRTGLRKRDNI